MADIVSINACFGVSFWGLEHALPFIGKSAALLRVYAIKCAMHYQAHRLVEALQQRGGSLLNTF
jgi:hypothetical protein